MISDLDIAEYAITYGTEKGLEYIESRLVDSYEEDYITRNGMFISLQDKYRKGIGIRVLVNGGMGFGSTESLNKDSIEHLIDRIVKMAKNSNRNTPIRFSEEKTVNTSWKPDIKIPFIDMDKKEKQNYIKELDKRVKREVKGKLSSRIFVFMLYTDKKIYMNNEGTKILSENSLPAVYTMTTARGPQGTEQRMFGQGGCGGWEWFKEVNFGDQLVNDCIGLSKAAQYAKSKRFEKPIDVVISGEVAGIMSHENVGHPSEADRILGREAAQAGESFYGDLLKNQRLGEIKLGNETVNIIEDPTIPKSAGFYKYDDEGVQACPRYLIKNGKLNQLLLNRQFAAELQTSSNAGARAISFDREPITRMANTYFAPGDFSSLDEIVEDIKNGMYMKSFTEWNIDDRRFQSKYVGLEAYLIENGEISNTMIRRPILELTTYGILGSVDAIGKSVESYYGTCGKSDPMQGVPVSMGGAEVRMRNIQVGGGL